MPTRNKVKLVRFPTSKKEGTPGVLLIDGEFFCYTLEPPREDAHPCIPEGCYRCVKEFSKKFGQELYELKDVPGREEIKFHAGNTLKDTQGCILLGFDARCSNTWTNNAWYRVAFSRPTLAKFMFVMSSLSEFSLYITTI